MLSSADKRGILGRAKRVIQWGEKLHWKLIPLLGKDPSQCLGADWGTKTPRAADFYAATGLTNIGVQVGPISDGLCDFDIDTDDNRAVSILLDYVLEHDPIIISRGGMARHLLMKITDRPDDTLLTTHKYWEFYGGDDKLNLRLGGRDETGKDASVQTMIWGTHPTTHQKLDWNWMPHTADDVPPIPWANLIAIWENVGEDLHAKPSSAKMSVVTPEQAAYYAAEADSRGYPKMSWLCQQLSGYSYRVGGGGRNKCPWCYGINHDISFAVFHDDQAGMCWHDTSCPSFSFASRDKGTVTVLDVIGRDIGCSPAEDFEYVEEHAWDIADGKAAFPQKQERL